MSLKDRVYNTATGRQGYAARLTWQQETPTGTVNGTNKDFVLSTTPAGQSSTFTYLDGMIVPVSKWSLSTATVSFTTAPQTGQEVYVVYQK